LRRERPACGGAGRSENREPSRRDPRSEATRRAGARRPRAASRHVPGRLRAARSPGVVHRRGRRALGYRSRGGASACAPRAPHAARLPISPRRGDAMTANLVCRLLLEKKKEAFVISAPGITSLIHPHLTYAFVGVLC